MSFESDIRDEANIRKILKLKIEDTLYKGLVLNCVVGFQFRLISSVVETFVFNIKCSGDICLTLLPHGCTQLCSRPIIGFSRICVLCLISVPDFIVIICTYISLKIMQ